VVRRSVGDDSAGQFLLNDERGAAPAAPVTRRAFMQATALAGVGAFLAACGAKQTGSASPAAATGSGSPAIAPSASATAAAAAGTIGGDLNFANQIGYMDISDDGSTYPSLERFTKETGVRVNYDETITDNEEFFSTDLQVPLGKNLPPGWDLIVVTDWMVARLARLGWLEAIDLTATPNFQANLLPQYHARSFDPETKFAAPLHSGMTGIGFDRKQTGDLTSLAALWDPKSKGRITYLPDKMRDTIGLTAIRLGFDPATITRQQFDQALAEIDKAVKGKLLLLLSDDSYVEAMAAGDAIVAMAFSADVMTLLVPSQRPDQDFRFVVATEGGMLWTDNMCMPKGVKNRKQAQAFINFYYDPTVAAQVEASVKYVCPVKGAAEVLKAKDPGVANNPLIFPPADVIRRLHQFRALDAKEEKDWSDAFSKVLPS
jgi:spermidine/putrescine transport system substrate-binding protein